MEYCFGIDIGGTTVKMGLFLTSGTIVEKWEVKTRTENKGETILSDIAASLQEKMEHQGIKRGQIAGIGVGIPAPVDADGVVQNTANLGWGYKEVKREMEELIGIEVQVGNDANVAALGEMWLGAGKGHKNMIMVTLGTGVGGGVIVNGQAVSGGHGAGGEIGHICVNYSETEQCGCGNRGCLEQYTSATGITRLANKRLRECDDSSLLRNEKVNAKAVFDALKAGDKIAEAVIEQFGTYLGHAMANLAAITDPEVIVIGGGVSKAGSILLQCVEKYFQERAFFSNKKTNFLLAELGNDAGICGAASLIIR